MANNSEEIVDWRNTLNVILVTVGLIVYFGVIGWFFCYGISNGYLKAIAGLVMLVPNVIGWIVSAFANASAIQLVDAEFVRVVAIALLVIVALFIAIKRLKK